MTTWNIPCFKYKEKSNTTILQLEVIEMVIKCSLPISQERISDYFQRLAELPPLPDCIMKRNIYFNKRKSGGVDQITVVYHCDKSKFEEARENISKQLEFVRGLPGFNLSAHIYGPHPSHLTLEAG